MTGQEKERERERERKKEKDESNRLPAAANLFSFFFFFLLPPLFWHHVRVIVRHDERNPNLSSGVNEPGNDVYPSKDISEEDGMMGKIG